MEEDRLRALLQAHVSIRVELGNCVILGRREFRAEKRVSVGKSWESLSRLVEGEGNAQARVLRSG